MRRGESRMLLRPLWIFPFEDSSQSSTARSRRTSLTEPARRGKLGTQRRPKREMDPSFHENGVKGSKNRKNLLKFAPLVKNCKIYPFLTCKERLFSGQCV